jgi:uncharacterized protein YcbX
MVISQILVYPIKSFDGVSVKEARITSGGILEFDRIYAIVDESGAYVNAKRTPRIQLLRATFDPLFQEVCLWQADDPARRPFSLVEPETLNRHLSEFFGFSVKLTCEKNSGFPDDRTAFGPTVTSEASLVEVTKWFPEVDVSSARRRFRSNLEIAGVPPFWEDHLFGGPNETKPFRIGEVHFCGHNPCQRCAVPTRDPDRAESLPNFQKSFMELRRKHLPTWSNPERFNHYYRFAINTSILPSEAGKWLRVGDTIQLGGSS